MSEILQLQDHLSLKVFMKKSSAPITRMKKQRGNRGELIKQIMKAYENHQLVFQIS